MRILNAYYQANTPEMPWKPAAWRLVIALFVAFITPVVIFTLLIFLVMVVEIFNLGIPLLTSLTSLENAETDINYLFAIPIFFGAGAIGCSGVQVLIIGTPLAIIGWRFNLIRRWTSIAGGFLVGSLPFLIMSIFPAILLFIGNIILIFRDGIQMDWKGIAQTAGDFSELIPAALFMGFWGMVGGFAFWLTWRYFARSSPSEQNRDIPAGI